VKILFVVHQFLPRHAAGTEIYTFVLAKELQARGHEVRIFTTEIHPERPQYELGEREHEGLWIHEAVHNHAFDRFEAHYLDPRQEENFRKVLASFPPDLVHFQHLHLHSLGYIDEVHRRGLPMVYTLHEYILMCLRGGQLLRPDGGVCEAPDPGLCAACATFLPRPDAPPVPPPGPLERWAKRLLPKGLRSGIGGLFRREAAPPVPGNGEDPYVAAVSRRLVEVRRRLSKVDLFLSPSAFLRKLFLENRMMAPERILHSDNGFQIAHFHKVERVPSDRLRIGYIGTIAPYKGVHLLVEAFRDLDLPGIECRIYGDMRTFPDYGEELEAMERPSNLSFEGRFDNARIGEVLAGLDVLVVPSLWFENSPLTIHEAFLAGVPVLTADRGGMAELVEDGVHGLHFEMGNAADLARKIRRLLEEPGLLESLRGRFPKVKTIGEDTDLMEERYRILRDGGLPER